MERAAIIGREPKGCKVGVAGTILALALYWHYTSTILALYWHYTVTILALYLHYTGTILALYWHYTCTAVLQS